MPPNPSRKSESMRWLIDEGVPKAVVDWLAGRGDDVLDIAASDLRGSPDVRLWRLAARQGRLIVARDLDFPLRRVTPSPPGVVLVRAPNTFHALAILGLVQEGLAEVPAETLPGNITVIKPGRVRQRPLASPRSH